MEAIRDDNDVDARHVLITQRLRKKQEAVEAEIKFLDQGELGRFLVHGPQMDDSLRSRLSFDQVRKQRIIIRRALRDGSCISSAAVRL